MNLSLIIEVISGVSFFLFWLVTFFILYHLTRFGIGILPKRVAALFLVGAVVLFSTSLLLYFSLDLTQITL